MVSTRLMSTSNNAGNSTADESARLSVVTRQTISNYVMVNCSTIPPPAPPQRQQLGASSSSSSTSRQQSHLTQAVKASNSSHNNNSSTNSLETTPVPRVSQIQLLDLPTEILSTIFSYVGYKKIGQIRVVSHKMNDVCMHVLNSTFSKLITQTYNRFHAIKANMPRRESARRNHPLACECDIIETCYMRLSLLQMTFGKHIERGHCCFFPGAILDEVYTILNYIKNTPRLERPYRVTDELFDLSTMAMEYFRDRIEQTLPDIAYFNKDYFKLHTTKRPALVIASDLSDSSSSLPSPPQSNMVLRKGIRKIKQGMKIYNNQLSVLRNELRTCKRKSSEQGKQIAEQQKLLAEQQKQTVEYANRLDENDKKNEEMSRKFSTLLQELNKCKTELQYWRSKSPAIPICTSCGQKVTPVLPAEDYQALINQGVKPEDIILNLNDDTDAESDASMSEHNLSLSGEFVFPDETTTAKLLAVNTATKHLKRQHSTSAGCGNSMYGEEMPTTSTNVQRQEKHGMHGSGKLTEMTSCLDYSNQNIIKTTTCTPTSNSHVKDLNSISSMAATGKGAPSSSTSSTAASSQATGCDNSNNISVAHGNGNVGGGSGSGIGGYPTSLFYGTNVHKGVIVSPSMLAKSEMNSNELLAHQQYVATNTSPSASNDSDVVVVAAAGVEDVTSLNAITSSNETKKARRVQKATRCTNGSGKRSK